MLKNEYFRARQPASIDDRFVVVLVGEDHLARPGQRAYAARVGEVARAEQERCVTPRERRQLLLEAAVDRHRARHQSRGARAGAPAHRCLGRCLANGRMVCQSEVVVRAQQQDGIAVEQHAGPLRTADEARAALQSHRPQLIQPRLDVDHPSREARPRLGRFRGTMIRPMPDRLYFTDSDEANELIATDPMALLIGFALDQQVHGAEGVLGPARAARAARLDRCPARSPTPTSSRSSASGPRSTASRARWPSASTTSRSTSATSTTATPRASGRLPPTRSSCGRTSRRCPASAR